MKIKALEWDGAFRTTDGIYKVRWYMGEGAKHPYYLARASRILGWFDTIDEAKQAAQLDHEARVRAAIEHGEPVDMLRQEGE